MDRPLAEFRSASMAIAGKTHTWNDPVCYFSCAFAGRHAIVNCGTASRAGEKALRIEKTTFRKRIMPALYDFALMIDMAEDEG